jgi:hypothetical protein
MLHYIKGAANGSRKPCPGLLRFWRVLYPVHSLYLEKDLKKFVAALIASLFATIAFAQTTAPVPDAAGPAPKAVHHKHKKQTKKPIILDKTKLGEGQLK